MNLDFWTAVSTILSPFAAIFGAPGVVFQALTNVPEAIKGLGELGIQKVIERLPDGGNYPSTVHDGAIYLGTTLSKADVFFPTYDLLLIMTLVFSIKMILWALHLGIVILNYIRGIPTQRYQMGIPTTGPLTNQQSYQAKVRSMSQW